jgi:hypothetical protein
VTDDPFKTVRDHLAAARTSLEASRPRTDAPLDRVRAVERQLEWRGDPYTADYELSAIIADLGELKARTEVAADVQALEPNGAPVLLPGVADAIGQLGQAVGLLRAMWSKGSGV